MRGEVIKISPMTKTVPKVSVLLPVYNAEKYLKKTIDSILAQSFKDFELIIIDDASTDSSGEIIRTYKDRRIVVVSNETNLQLIESLNRGLSASRGELIARCDADDLYHSHRFQKQVDYLSFHPNVAVVGSDAWFIDSEGGVTGTTRFFPSATVDVAARLLRMSPLFHPSVMIRAHVLKEVGGYDPRRLHAEDYALWLAIAERGYQLGNIPEKLMHYRIHSNSISRTHSDTQSKTSAEVLGKFLNKNLNLTYDLQQMREYQNPQVQTHTLTSKEMENIQEAKALYLSHHFSRQAAKLALAKDETWFLVRRTVYHDRKTMTLLSLFRILFRHPSVVFWMIKGIAQVYSSKFGTAKIEFRQ